MKKLSGSQKLRLTRLGRSLKIKDVSKKVFLSESYISFMESGTRKVPSSVEKVLDFDAGIRWYLTIVDALQSEEDGRKALEILNKVLKI